MIAPSAEDRIWLTVSDPAMAGAVRRAAVGLGREAGFDEAALGDLAIVTMEVATNLARHADNGTVCLRTRRTVDRLGVEIVAMDRGPGMPDIDAASRDGHSTAGTLGIGLGAIRRIASEFDAYSAVSSGTVLAATIWAPSAPQRTWIDGLSRPLAGESVCGDAFAGREFGGRRQVLLCDGLGHGSLAALAAQAVVLAFLNAPEAAPKTVIEHIHRATAHTRGSVVGVAELDGAAGRVRYSGIGNVAATVGAERRRVMVSLPGIVGQQVRDIREFDYPLDPHGFVVLHSDGLTDRWALADYPGLATREPLLIAATLMRDASKRRDDAAVVVANAR
jgi:anti-sigma regulatory factor (Ser/Thr protein kinase)